MNSLFAVALVVLWAGLMHPLAAGIEPAEAIRQLKNYRFGASRAPVDALEKWVSDARRKPETRARAAAELAAVLDSEATFDAKQFGCRQLVLIAGTEQIPILAGQLGDESLGHYALMVLAQLPGPAMAQALRKTLAHGPDRIRMEIMDVLGEKHVTEAIPELVEALSGQNPALADAAAVALGKMNDEKATTALQAAHKGANAKWKSAIEHALLGCADRCFAANQKESALSIYQWLYETGAAEPIRSSAWRSLVRAHGADGVPTVIDALKQDGSRTQELAAQLARELPGPAATRALSRQLGALSPHGQLLLLSALADRADPAGIDSVSELRTSPDAAVRLAVIRTLGGLNDGAVVPVLLEISAGGVTGEADVARLSLARLKGNGVDEALMSILGTGQSVPLRREAILALGARQARQVLPQLIPAVKNQPPELRKAALAVLADLGEPAQLRELLGILPKLEKGDRVEAVRALAAMARRAQNESERTGTIVDRLQSASDPAEKVELLGLLGEVGGPNALGALKNALAEANPDLQKTAIRQLAEWPTDEPLDVLADWTRKARAEGRTLALRGFIRMIGLNEDRHPSRALALYKQAMALAEAPEEKRLVLAGLARVKSGAALEYSANFMSHEPLRGEAELAAVEIGRSTAGAFPEKTRAILESILARSGNETARARAQELLSVIARFGDFIMAWEASPFYQVDGADCSRLFDIPFPPENTATAETITWRLAPVGTAPNQPWLVDLLPLWGGDQRVAYLRTIMVAETDRAVVLELGSDDGVKVWCNGGLVHSANVQRAVAPSQEKVKLNLKAGQNVLLVKVTQNVMGWGICARVTNPDGSPAAGLKWGVSLE